MLLAVAFAHPPGDAAPARCSGSISAGGHSLHQSIGLQVEEQCMDPLRHIGALLLAVVDADIEGVTGERTGQGRQLNNGVLLHMHQQGI